MHSLKELENSQSFCERHIGPNEDERREMLTTLGMSSMEALIEKVIPGNIRSRGDLALEDAGSETQVLEELRGIASKNKIFKNFIGLGYYGTHTPTVIQRNLLENPGWYTAYTPYQSEISQGRLEALLNFQTMISELTGLEIANASVLDEATAAAEAMTLCKRLSKSRSDRFLVAADCHPQSIDVIRTRANPLGIQVELIDPQADELPGEAFGVLLQYPGTYGDIRDYRSLVDQAHEQQTLVAMSADLLALTLIASPGDLGADIAIGSSQRFGVPLGFGGPHAGYMAVREKAKRFLPGRLVGVSTDSKGRNGYRLALATREQHIRREKATSNICTAQALLAIIASMYAVYHGPEGLRRIANRTHRLTVILSAGLEQLGFAVNKHVFDTIKVSTGGRAADIAERARERQVNLRVIDEDEVGISLDETTTRVDVGVLWEIFSDAGALSEEVFESDHADRIPEGLRRASPYLTHPVFHRYRSETELMRYMRRLSDLDLALDRSMIPLGSCTMKLNAATEMVPITWSEFADLHPFAPIDQAEGYQLLFQQLEDMLCECTGYSALSLQPNAGSQGEYAGLLAIKAYHESRGEGHRNVCLIPSSAHGTNPASAAMVNLKVVVVNSDRHGNIDVDDLKAKAEKYADELAAIMITYPSTHGVFEPQVREVCDIVHDNGGQVYIDGANLNAMVGLCKPAEFGGDVSHLNLHKTFAIPHGGGGPGVGPIGVREHLRPFLPGHAHLTDSTSMGPVAAAPWGSAGVLPITWCYLRLLGKDGLKSATENAILNANYIAKRLQSHYPLLYTGLNNMVAHECILDTRPIKESSGISVEDIAKRLIDYGFHAPTMSFPVSGTLMVEPTESESKYELDRFIDAMIHIRDEISDIETGKLDKQNNPLTNAPHTARDMTEPWDRPYGRDLALCLDSQPGGIKYWPPVNRIDNVLGDRTLICTCPPISDYEEIDAERKSA